MDDRARLCHGCWAIPPRNSATLTEHPPPQLRPSVDTVHLHREVEEMVRDGVGSFVGVQDRCPRLQGTHDTDWGVPKRLVAWPEPPHAKRACPRRAHRRCRSALLVGWRWPSFWRVVLLLVDDARRRLGVVAGSLTTRRQQVSAGA